MPRFSANLGFLWAELALPDAIRAAARAGFDAVECHWPYGTPPLEVRSALEETGLPMLGLNTRRGDDGDFGLAALPDRIGDALAAIDEAIGYAREIGANNVHVMAGFATGEDAESVFMSNLTHACKKAAEHGITVLIEPINSLDVPGYFLSDCRQAEKIIDRLALPNLKLMFDCYHIARNGDDVLVSLERNYERIGHIQIASVPDRAEPDHGELDYEELYRFLDVKGYERPLGAEYRPAVSTGAGLAWLTAAKGV